MLTSKPCSVSAQINAIRAKAGNPMTHCPICTRPAGAPFRVYDERGAVTAGCIDAFHTGHLPSCSESQFWHNRKVAQDMRRKELAHLKSLKPSRKTA